MPRASGGYGWLCRLFAWGISVVLVAVDVAVIRDVQRARPL
jgi:hypothetical protein